MKKKRKKKNKNKQEKEIFIPEEENFSPNALQLWLLKKKGKVEEIKRSKSQRSPLSKGTFNHDMYPNENIGSTLCNMNQKDSINRTISRDLFSDLGGDFRVWKILILSVTLYLKCEKN